MGAIAFAGTGADAIEWFWSVVIVIPEDFKKINYLLVDVIGGGTCS